MLTKPTVFADAIDRNDSVSAWILRVEVSASLTLLFSDVSGLSLSDGEVFPVDLQVNELVHQASIYQTSSTSGTAKVVISNAPYAVDTSNVGIRPSLKMVLMANRPAQLYLAVGSAVGALTDCLKVFDGVAVADPEYSTETLSMELVDASVVDNALLPNEDIADDFPGSVAATLGRQYPIVLGELLHADGYHAGPLALAEELTSDDWVIAKGSIESVTNMWLYHQGFGDFMLNQEVGSTTLVTAASASDTLIDLDTRADFAVGDRVVLDAGGVDEEVNTIVGFNSGHVAKLATGLINAHAISTTVDRSYLIADDGTRASVKLMRQIKTLIENNVRYRVEAYNLKGYIRPESQSDAPDVYVEAHKHQTYCAVTNSVSGQAVLNVASTIGFGTGQSIDIDPDAGGGGSETKIIKRIIDAGSIELTANLTFSHTTAQADVVRPTSQFEETDNDNFDHCRDHRSDTFATINVADIDGSNRTGRLQMAFTDIDVVKSNINNNVGFIYDYGSFINFDPAPSVTLSFSSAIIKAGRGVPLGSSQERISAQSKTASIHDEDSHFGAEANLLWLVTAGAHSVILPLTNNAPATTLAIVGPVRGFNVGARCTFGPETAREEQITINALEEGATIYLESALRNDHASGDGDAIRTLRNDGAIGIFWALGTGDEQSGLGVHLEMVAQSTGSHALGDALMRVNDAGLYFLCYTFSKPFASQPLAYREINIPSRGTDIPWKGNRGGPGLD